MKVLWRKSAVDSLIALDHWREDKELLPISSYLFQMINQYFTKQDFSVYIPGRQVLISPTSPSKVNGINLMMNHLT